MRFADIQDKETTEIVFNYYLNEYKHHRLAIKEYKKLNTVLANPMSKLHRIGNIVFLLTIKDDELEFHSMGQEVNTFAFIKNLYALSEYAKELKVHAMYSYSNDKIFDTIFRRIKLDFTKDIKVGPDGITYNYYRLEF